MLAADFKFIDAIKGEFAGQDHHQIWIFEARQFLGRVASEVMGHNGTVEDVRQIIFNDPNLARFFHPSTSEKERQTVILTARIQTKWPHIH